MKKTLLIAAAALAAGIISSQAQSSVYSQNIVGYVNIPLTNGVLTAVSPALDLDGNGTNNTLSSVFPAPSVGDYVYVFNGSGYDSLSYIIKNLGGHPATFSTNWYDASSGLIATNYSINPGQGAFYLPAANETATIVGSVIQGTNLVNKYFPAANQINLVSSIVPIAGGLTSALKYNPTVGDYVYVYDAGQYDSYSYIIKNLGGHPATFATNWYNASSGLQSEPTLNVGQSFWILPASNTNWVESFAP